MRGAVVGWVKTGLPRLSNEVGPPAIRIFLRPASFLTKAKGRKILLGFYTHVLCVKQSTLMSDTFAKLMPFFRSHLKVYFGILGRRNSFIFKKDS